MIELGTNQQKRIINGKTNQSITSAEETLIESVKLFTNLRGVIILSRVTNKNTRRRLGLVCVTYNQLSHVWKISHFPKISK